MSPALTRLPSVTGIATIVPDCSAPIAARRLGALRPTSSGGRGSWTGGTDASGLMAKRPIINPNPNTDLRIMLGPPLLLGHRRPDLRSASPPS